MPSKKAKGKAKKASKAAKKKEATEDQAERTVVVTKEESLEAQTQQLKIDNETQDDDDDAFLEEAIKLAAAENKVLLKAEKKKAAKLCCAHGCDPLPEDRDCVGFMNIFFDEYKAGHKRGEHHIIAVINAGKAANEKYPDVVGDSAKIGWIISHFLASGTKSVLNRENQQARQHAFVAFFFEEMIATKFHKTQATSNHAKMMEMLECDEHTLVKYFRKHIPCKCLDEKYKKVKSITKIGVCMNPECSLPPGKVERKGMLHCIRCRKEYYCSRECQEAHWPRHREWCDKYVDEQAAFEAMQQVWYDLHHHGDIIPNLFIFSFVSGIAALKGYPDFSLRWKQKYSVHIEMP